MLNLTNAVLPSLATKLLLAPEIVKEIGLAESYQLSGNITSEEFEAHSKAAVGNYDSLLIYSYESHTETWEVEGETKMSPWDDPDWMMTNGVIDRTKCYYSMVVPVIDGVPDYSRWSFASDWEGYPRKHNEYLEEEKYDDLIPSVRGKRQSIEKKRGFRGNPNMRMAA